MSNEGAGDRLDIVYRDRRSSRPLCHRLFNIQLFVYTSHSLYQLHISIMQLPRNQWKKKNKRIIKNISTESAGLSIFHETFPSLIRNVYRSVSMVSKLFFFFTESYQRTILRPFLDQLEDRYRADPGPRVRSIAQVKPRCIPSRFIGRRGPGQGPCASKGEGLRLRIYRVGMRQEQRQIYRGIPEELSRSPANASCCAFTAGSREICSFLLRQFDPSKEIALWTRRTRPRTTTTATSTMFILFFLISKLPLFIPRGCIYNR